jgi:transposase InsO family protein
VLTALGIAASTWYRKPSAQEERKRPGPQARQVPEAIEALVQRLAEACPWYGYKKIAVICRWFESGITNRQVYKVMKKRKLLHKRKPRKAELYQVSKLYELLPQKPNDLWQMDVPYIHVPGHGWWYAITVIDYYSRYLLAAHFTSSYSALEATTALAEARAEAERIHGPLGHDPFVVTDNGSSFIAKRFQSFVKDSYQHVRIQYRTPTQLGLLERFHCTLKNEEVYWRLYDNPAHARFCLAEFRERYNMLRPHWALIPQEGGDPLTPSDVYVDGRMVRLPKWQGWAKGAKAKLDKLMALEAEDAA